MLKSMAMSMGDKLITKSSGIFRSFSFYLLFMDYVILNSYENYIEAHIAKGMLEEQGIPCWLKDENTVTINPIWTNAVGGIKIMVERKDAEQASNFLNRLRRGQQAAVACPKCGSHNVELVSTPRKASNWLTAITTFFLSDRAIALDKVYHCFDCQHEFPQAMEEVPD
jgi:DNA-directed RNA polymerase subunit RPC12/RpoP